jgi:hypothetical protein
MYYMFVTARAGKESQSAAPCSTLCLASGVFFVSQRGGGALPCVLMRERNNEPWSDNSRSSSTESLFTVMLRCKWIYKLTSNTKGKQFYTHAAASAFPLAESADICTHTQLLWFCMWRAGVYVYWERESGAAHSWSIMSPAIFHLLLFLSSSLIST